MQGKKINIACDCSKYLQPNELEPLQGKLKTLTNERAEKIKNSFIKYGFCFPIFVWKKPSSSKVCIIDGHQRLAVIQKMLSEGWSISGNRLPVDFIRAKTLKEAKEMILLASSRYGRIDQEGACDFIQGAGIDLEELKTAIDIPELFLDSYQDDDQNDQEESSEDNSSLLEAKFIVSKQQFEVIKQALEKVKTKGLIKDPTDINTDREGNAIFSMAHYFLANN